MAITISDTSYAGKYASPLIGKFATDFASINKGVLYVNDTVRKKLTVPTINVSNLIQDRAATPVSQGTVTINGRTMTPADFMVYWEFNPRDFEAHFEAENLTDALIKRELPAELLGAIEGELAKFVNSYMDFAVWRSRTSNTNSYKYYDGFVKKMLDDSDVIDVAGAGALSASNIEAKLNLVKDAIPDSIYDHPDGKYIMNVEAGKFWADAQRAGTYKGVGMTERGQLMFDGRPVVTIPGLHEDTILYTHCSNSLASNLHMAINSREDSLFQYDFLQANSELCFFKMLAKADVNYRYGSEIVLYTTQTA
jgi:hypothetical protein